MANALPVAGAAVTDAGNLGTTETVTLSRGRERWLIGTLNANCTITIAGLAAGVQGKLLLTQDATGGRTLTISDGSTSSTIDIPTEADESFVIDLFHDGDDLYVSPPADVADDPNLGRTVTPLWDPAVPAFTTRALNTANLAWFTRFRVRKPTLITNIKLVVTTLDAADPACSVAIMDGATTMNRLATSGAVTGYLTTAGVRTIPLSSTVLVMPDETYYAAISIATASAVIVDGIGFAGANVNVPIIGGNQSPNVLYASKATAHPIPTTVTPDGIPGAAPKLWAA